MKAKQLLFGLLVAVVLAGCGAGTGEKTAEGQEQAGAEVSSYNPVDGLITYVKASETEGEPSFEQGSTRLNIGEQIVFLGQTLKGKAGKRDVELSLIRTSDDKEVWIPSEFFIPDGKLGVVTSGKAVVYAKPDLLNPTSDILPRMTIVTASPQQENGFYQLTTWDEVNDKKYAGVHVKSNDLSLRDADVQSALLYFVAMKNTNPVVREELLNSAAEFLVSVFMPQIRAELEALAEGSSDEVSGTRTIMASEQFSFEGVVNSDNVNVRDFPGTAGTRIIAQLQPETEVRIVERTVEPDTVGGQSANWFKLDDPQGWVFGVFIDPR
jgi:hypothetical protein